MEAYLMEGGVGELRFGEFIQPVPDTTLQS